MKHVFKQECAQRYSKQIPMQINFDPGKAFGWSVAWKFNVKLLK